jgi:glutathione synthase/RimK-type ligase-like ATP-grasp enzyme
LNNNIVIITSKDDVHTDSLIKHFQAKSSNYNIIRINTEDFALNSTVSFEGDNVSIKLHDSDKFVNSKDILSVWFRRPKPILSNHNELNVRNFITGEWNAFLRGFYFCTHDSALWVNPLPNLHRARIKLQQIQLARKLNLKVPDTVVSNNFKHIEKLFIKHDKVCVKTLNKPSFKVEEYNYLPIYTKVVTHKQFISNQESLCMSPVIFQQFIKKICDIRVIIIGDTVNAFSIFSKNRSKAEVDFRHGFKEGLSYKVIDLPREISKKLIKFVKTQGLNFSAIDLILDVNEKYWFLENNPNGQWLWLELATGYPLTEIMANFLSTGKKSI